jgi:hypothetical protein
MSRVTGWVFNRELWRAIFAGPLKIKVVIERPDGTELYHFYPVSHDVHAGQTVHLDFEVGLHLTEV